MPVVKKSHPLSCSRLIHGFEKRVNVHAKKRTSNQKREDQNIERDSTCDLNRRIPQRLNLRSQVQKGLFSEREPRSDPIDG